MSILTALLAALLGGCGNGGNDGGDSGTGAAGGDGYDPADYAENVIDHATQAGINPQLLMAILYNESYKPHDPELERAWQEMDPTASLGIANMKQPAFDDAKQGREFADRDWLELPDDRDLAVQAAAWYLHDLATMLPDSWAGPLDEDELIALGYNTGPGNMRLFADGTALGSQAQSYLDRLHDHWDDAADALA